jgi:CRP/FNR family transcriptional regulator
MNAQAIRPTRMRCLSVAALYHLAATDPLIGFKLYEGLAGELAATRDLLFSTGRRNAMQRVVSFLLAFSRRHRPDLGSGCFELPMTRADIDATLGLSIETVSRTFTKRKMLGLIELPRSNHVKFADIEELQNLADGEERTTIRAKPKIAMMRRYRSSWFNGHSPTGAC